ncbi:hypothetical protein GYMLUDRAFT_76215 [Collybiopsis luxurians FD-317 M1]|uniref:Glucose-6-phosphate 1-dehydrogenase n=1 Tax=Collybiopsis luxurians FD-317 M1 TaxID=944289 RepID=A0A0D0CE04_9AGAR|nr:hypothetical protein GYMLUDRAFT_76215 [Collybiopsis luxurians FD-317 M1]
MGPLRLTSKFLYPALFTLFRRGLLPQSIHIVGAGPDPLTHEEYLQQATSEIKDHGEDFEKYKAILSYRNVTYTDGATFVPLGQYLKEIESGCTTGCNRVYYLSIAFDYFVGVSEHLKQHVYSDEATNRLVVEKPIGSDLESALEIVEKIAEIGWTEEETFRIDHYLGQEIVKNLLVLRFANSSISRLWDSDSISNVQITLNESFDVAGRGDTFDKFGMIRDVIQNHLCQVLSVLTMERPVNLSPSDIIDEKVKLLRSIPPIEREDVLLGQYIGYLDEDNVPNDSTTATYAATVLWINNPRWENVPFILKAGKALNEDNVEIRMQFKDGPKDFYDTDPPRSELIMQLEPGKGIYMKLNIKTPGFDMDVTTTELKLNYEDTFSKVFIPSPYEALLRDVVKGDHSTFVRDDELAAAWKIFTPILHWTDGTGGEEKPIPIKYERGSRGPAGLDEFLAKYGYKP